jgi:hypothetical protein
MVSRNSNFTAKWVTEALPGERNCFASSIKNSIALKLFKSHDHQSPAGWPSRMEPNFYNFVRHGNYSKTKETRCE